MSIWLYLNHKKHGWVFEKNLTNNLSEMAKEAGVYEFIFGCQTEHKRKAKEAIRPLNHAIGQMKNDPTYYKRFNPPNGWGDYDGFLMAISGHKRYAYPTSTLLYHQVSSGYKGKLKDIESDVIEVKRLQKMMEQHVLALTGITKSRLKESYNAKEDWHISAHQALKLKCIDEIL